MRADPRLPGYALSRLLWRPAALFVALVPLWAVVFPTLFLPNGPSDLMAALHSGVGRLEVQYALWRESVLVPGVLGFIFGGITHEALQSGVSWMLPRYRARIFLTTTVVAVLCALLVAVAAVSVISLRAGVAAFGLGILSFAAGWRPSDPVASRAARWTGALALAALAIRPDQLARLAEAQAIVLGLAASISGAVLLGAGMTPGTARKRVLLPRASGLLGGKERMPWQSFSHHLSPRTLPGLIYAGFYESPSKNGGRFQAITFQIVFLSVFGWIVRSSSMVATLPMIFVGFAGSQLKDVFAYPMSRRRRADAFFVASLVDAVTMAAVTAGAVVFLFSMGWWRTNPAGSTTTLSDALIGLLFLLLFIPLAQAAQAPGPLSSIRRRKIPARQWILYAVGVGLWMGASLIARFNFTPLANGMPALLVVAVVLASFVVIQTAFWASLRFYFARRDFA